MPPSISPSSVHQAEAVDPEDHERPAALREPSLHARTVAEIGTRAAKRATKLAATTALAGTRSLRGRLMRVIAARRLEGLPSPRRLCLGSGHAPIAGWINIDFEPPADILLDLRFGIPVPNGTIDSIFSEHLLEHLRLEEAQAHLRECRRVLVGDGVLRVAVPDLESLVDAYQHDWRAGQDWISWPENAYVDTPVRMLNVAMREWGHQYMYDFGELAIRLREAGFTRVDRVTRGASLHEHLRGLETRADSQLVVEAS